MLPRRGMIHRPLPQPPFTPGIYRHYKGGTYKALLLACDEATHEWMVLYQPLYDHAGMPDWWVRPYRDFFGAVKRDGTQIPRFQKLADE